uniref:eEF1A lysine and N-terminal methyltransferase n=1 Tax=Erigeron canadensis TaxID=72917 RepID=UPI001CB8AEEC|nr:eEF1A lysine and N-terminal methyltransferase [Erigeron canadensis]
MGKGKQRKGKKQEAELLSTLDDFTSKENWDKFFSIKGTDDPFEWYAEWPQLHHLLVSEILGEEKNSTRVVSEVQILVPGCGNSRLSEHLYDDAGFKSITNIDFSKVVIADMLKRNLRSRPCMRWRVMDMTAMQFADKSFDVVLDKGGLDALMEPALGPMLGNRYVSEVKRVLKEGGKFICLTLAESHVLGMFFPKFRYGWKISIHVLPQKPSKRSDLRTFMLVAEKANPTVLQMVLTSFYRDTLGSGDQASGMFEALETENKVRAKWSSGNDILYSLEDLKIGVKGDLSELSPGRRIQLTLGEPGESRFCYKTVLLDAKQNSDDFLYNCGVFFVPKTRSQEWLYASEEGQWMIVESSKSARLIMVFLDSSHTGTTSEELQKDLSPLVKQLAPANIKDPAQIPFMAASDGIKERKAVHQVTSPLTGEITVDDVIYEKVDSELGQIFFSKDLIYRRLTFERSENLIQSEGLLTRERSLQTVSDKNNKSGSSKSKKKGTQTTDSNVSLAADDNDLSVDHGYLASSYHSGIISGFMLISSHLDRMASSRRPVRAVVIGLGAGLLPMFLHGCIPFLQIEAAELDPVVVELARDYFGFREDERLKVHVTDGIKFVGDVTGKAANENNDKLDITGKAADKGNDKLDILIIDVDSPDSSSGMTCPAADFVEESFLKTVKSSLSEEGLFVINLVSRSQAIKEMVISRMKAVFGKLFSLQLEEDVNEVIFALNSEVNTEFSSPDAYNQLEKLLNVKDPGMKKIIIDSAKKIKPLDG